MMGGCFHLESLPWKRSANYIAKISINYYDYITSLTYQNILEVSNERKTKADGPFADILPFGPRHGLSRRRAVLAIWFQGLALPSEQQLHSNLPQRDSSRDACADRGPHTGAHRDACADRGPHARAHRDAVRNGSSSLYRRRLYYGFHNGARGKCISFTQPGSGRQRPFSA